MSVEGNCLPRAMSRGIFHCHSSGEGCHRHLGRQRLGLPLENLQCAGQHPLCPPLPCQRIIMPQTTAVPRLRDPGVGAQWEKLSLGQVCLRLARAPSPPITPASWGPFGHLLCPPCPVCLWCCACSSLFISWFPLTSIVLSALAGSLCSETGDKPLAFGLPGPTLITPAASAWERGQEVGKGGGCKDGGLKVPVASCLCPSGPAACLPEAWSSASSLPQGPGS